jgi:hypothetical protein
MMPKKKTVRGAAKDTSDRTQSKRRQHTELRPTDELLMDAGYIYSERYVDELLEIVGDGSPQSRRDLLNTLQLAQLAYEDELERGSREQPSSRLILQLENSIEKTCKLLRRIRAYHDFRHLGFVLQQIGRGVVAPPAQGLPLNPTISDHELIFPKVDGKVVGINIEPLLRATLLHARRRRRGRGGAKQLGKRAVVFYAEGYFRQHSPEKPSRYAKNRFHEFAERFYEVVTKTEPDDLDRQMRNIFADRRSGQ